MTLAWGLGALVLLAAAGWGWKRRRPPKQPVAVPPSPPVAVPPSPTVPASSPGWLRAAPSETVNPVAAASLESLGPYKILSTLGQGGMATVYRALDSRTDQFIALKVVRADLQSDADFMRRFEREIEITQKLKHANLVEVYEAGPIDGQLAMAMELAEGLSLEDLLQGGPLPLEDFPILACQITAGLHYAHRQELVHRDIKPANIFVGRDALVKILDFGLAIGEGQSRFTSVGFSMGTPSYMAPEGLQKGVSDAFTDQYALGIVFYQILTGRLPFLASTPLEVARMQVKEAPAPPTTLRPEIPAEWEKIVLRMLAKKPEDRFATLGEVRTLLNTALLNS